jgi:folate-binding protein YgfZ
MFSHDQYQALQHGIGLLDRRSRGRLQLTGPDRRTYLHGLLTNDILVLSAGMGCYAALLTPQGRMISDMRVSELGDRVLIDLPEATTDSVRQRFTDFIFTEAVEVRDAAPDLQHFGVYGPEAAAVLSKSLTWLPPSALAKASADRRSFSGGWSGGRVSAGGSLPAEAGSHEVDPLATLQAMALDTNRELGFGTGTVVIIRSDDYGVAGFETFVSTSEAGPWVKALRAGGAVDVDAAAVEVTRVEAGRPEYGSDMDDHTIPLEAGIEERAISQTKGCYVGQEVIVRVLHRGQGRVARHLVGLMASHPDTPLSRGMRLEAAGGKSIGSITSAVLSPRVGRPIALGYVQRDFAEPGRVVQVAGDAGSTGPSLTVVTTPFVRPASE